MDGENARPAHHTRRGFRNPVPIDQGRLDVIVPFLFRRMLGVARFRPGAAVVVANDGSALRNGGSGAPTVTWIGHATVLVQMDGVTFITDPIWSSVASPLSFVGMPREAAYDNYHLYLAVLFIPLFVVPVTGWLYVPLYHRLRLTSAYEYLERRFDRRMRRCGSLLFGLYTLGWMGSMLYATGLIVQAALGVGEVERIVTMIVLGSLTAAYTTLGGYKATIWTNDLSIAYVHENSAYST